MAREPGYWAEYPGQVPFSRISPAPVQLDHQFLVHAGENGVETGSGVLQEIPLPSPGIQREPAYCQPQDPAGYHPAQGYSQTPQYSAQASYFPDPDVNTSIDHEITPLDKRVHSPSWYAPPESAPHYLRLQLPPIQQSSHPSAMFSGEMPLSSPLAVDPYYQRTQWIENQTGNTGGSHFPVLPSMPPGQHSPYYSEYPASPAYSSDFSPIDSYFAAHTLSTVATRGVQPARLPPPPSFRGPIPSGLAGPPLPMDQREIPAFSLQVPLPEPGPSRAGGRKQALPIATTGTAPKRSNVKARRVTVEEDANCIECRRNIGRIFRRGNDAQIGVNYRLAFQCLDCAPETRDSAPDQHEDGQENSRKRPRSDANNAEDLVECDVCHKGMCRGQVEFDSDLSPSQAFAVEYVCASCHSRYRRCTDCGAGGGRRLGAGKWRAAEMFSKDRRTCRLNHTRSGGPAEDTENIVYQTSDIDVKTTEYIASQCSEIIKTTMFANFAVPEIMEAGDNFSTFEIITFMANEGAAKVTRSICQPTVVPGTLKYVGVRLCKPKARKSRGSNATANENNEEPPPKEVAGFVVAEYDYNYGLAFIKLLAPWGSGDAYDMNLDLLEELFRQMRIDRSTVMREEGLDIKPNNALPPLSYAWTMLPLPRATRLTNYMERKRAFEPLTKFLEEHPQMSERLFPPYREAGIAPEELSRYQACA